MKRGYYHIARLLINPGRPRLLSVRELAVGELRVLARVTNSLARTERRVLFIVSGGYSISSGHSLAARKRFAITRGEREREREKGRSSRLRLEG
jgi:hypothetical protein